MNEKMERLLTILQDVNDEIDFAHERHMVDDGLIDSLELMKIIVALGAIAHQALLWSYGLKPKNFNFGHNVSHPLPDGRLLVDSYHCSGYNWRTGRLSRGSFEAVFADVQARLG